MTPDLRLCVQPRILALLLESPATTYQVADHTGLSIEAARRVLDRLQRRGVLRSTGRQGPHRPATWRLTPTRQDHAHRRSRWAHRADLSCDDDVLDSLRTLGPSTSAELAEDTGRSVGSVRRALRDLEAAGRVRATPHPEYRRWHRRWEAL